MQEGVIKFSSTHRDGPLPAHRFGESVARLTAWREILARLELVGQDAGRYEGAGYGNVSARIGPFPGSRGQRAFLITGTQTGGAVCVGAEQYCVVDRYDIGRNRVESWGPVKPSSESMTHGAIYDLGPHIRCVLHVHSPVLWAAAADLKLPTTAADVPYGTQAMAREVERLYRETTLLDRRIFAMAGHEDGIVVFGRTAEEAGQALLSQLAAAYASTCLARGQLCRR